MNPENKQWLPVVPKLVLSAAMDPLGGANSEGRNDLWAWRPRTPSKRPAEAALCLPE